MSAAPFCVGLTGGIGCGKSTVARLFEALGVAVVDADAIAHQLTQAGGQAIPLIRSHFGAAFLNASGAMDRTRMRQLILSDDDARQQLEAILHPLILDQCKTRLAGRTPYTILMAPLLLENPEFLHLVQRVLLVSCTETNQIERVRQRSGLDESEIRAIIARQMASAERLVRADDIIQNDGARDDLTNQVAALHQHYLNINNNNI